MNKARFAKLVSVFAMALITGFGGSQNAQAEPSLDALKAGFESIQEWQIDKAREIAEELYDEHPDDPLVLSLLAQVKLQTSDYAGAVHYFEAAKKNGAPDVVLSDAPLAEAAKVATKGYVETVSENFIVRHEPGKDAVLVPYAIDTLEMTLDSVGKLLGWKPSSRIIVEFYPSAATLAAVSTLTEEEIANSGTIALCKWNRLMVTTPRAIVFGYRWRDTLSHELVHLLISGVSKNSVPIWLHEGIAKFTETAWRAEPGLALSVEAQERLKEAAKKGTLIPFAKMHPSMAKLETQEESSLAFSEVFTFIEFLCERKGWKGMRELLASLSKGVPMEVAIEKIHGMPFGALTEKWKAALPKRKILTAGRQKGQDRELVIKKRSNTPDDKFHGLSKKARRFARAADLLYARGRMVAAQKELEKAYTITESPLLSAKIANIALAVNDLPGAEKAAKRAIDGVPDLPGPNLTLAEALVRQERSDEAMEPLDTAIDINPFDPRVHSLLLAVLGPEGNRKKIEQAQIALGVLQQSFRPRAPDLGSGARVQFSSSGFSRIFIVQKGDYGARDLATGMSTPSAPITLRPGPTTIKLVPPVGEPTLHEVEIEASTTPEDVTKVRLGK
ncbi:MAG: tetratricopeptide repeat protein [Myxococcota bacterium]|nr:tetratricopeptide repeat protein [Myxococcota bacterium]